MSHPFHGDPSHLDSPSRRKILPPDQLLAQMGINQGDTVIDFGAGIGYFSIPALTLVGLRGRVIAIDQSPQMLDELRTRAGTRPNLYIVQGTGLNDFIADKILLIAILHELENPEAFLGSAFDHLKKNGRIFIIDWQKKETAEGPPLQERIPKHDLLSMTSRPHREHLIHDDFYFIEFW